MMVSYIGDSEMKEVNSKSIVEIPNAEEIIMLKKNLKDMERRISEMNDK